MQEIQSICGLIHSGKLARIACYCSLELTWKSLDGVPNNTFLAAYSPNNAGKQSNTMQGKRARSILSKITNKEAT
ncbi:hypothetical protein [Nitrosomonas sp. Nm132]|uniref:hypothetical protein n=1 Tax=Nitrosomonas sp. Nm132 TaxID=1881053 RepID=UPI000885BC67|nr:hypothetical protein [Nitrosomonas sp. Nm132]SDH35684.1 hypothetical protein SAMN05428952_101149 [Nitrosomonas sp. Nm132]